MAQVTLRLQLRRDTAANWTSNDPTLSAGEIGYESDTDYIKIGDGTTAWTSLAYWSAFGGGLTMAGDLTISNADPRILLEETGVTAENTKWDFLADAEQLQFRVLNDAESAHTDWLTVDRTANTIDTIAMGATNITLTGALTATSYGGITEANLVDKNANETIAGAWTFSGLPKVGTSGTGDAILSFHDDTAEVSRNIRWNDTTSVFEFQDSTGAYNQFGSGGGGPDFLLGGM